MHSFIRDSFQQVIITTLKDADTLESPTVQAAAYKSSLRRLLPNSHKKSSFYLHKMEVNRLEVITQLWRGLLTFLQMSLDPPHLTLGQQIMVKSRPQMFPFHRQMWPQLEEVESAGNVWKWMHLFKSPCDSD